MAVAAVSSKRRGPPIKPYAHATDFHTAVDAVIDLARDNRIAAEDIERIDVTLPPVTAAALIESFERQRRPAGTREAKQSLLVLHRCRPAESARRSPVRHVP